MAFISISSFIRASFLIEKVFLIHFISLAQNISSSSDEEEPSPAKRQQPMDLDGDAPNHQSVQLKRSHISESIHRLYLNEDKADKHFTLQRQRIPVHKFILSLSSTVFDQMFYGPSSSTADDDLPVSGYSAKAFKNFLQFFYLDEITLKAATITEVVRMLHAHQMLKCVELCSRFWLEHYHRNNIDDICLAYEHALKLNVPELRGLCERIISLHSDRVLKTDGFLACPFNVLDCILSLDSLWCNESAVLNACMKWEPMRTKRQRCK